MHEQDLLLLILPLLLYVGIVVLFFGESKLLGKLANLSLFPLPVSFQPSLYPVLSGASADILARLSSDAVVSFDDTSKVVVISKNSDLVLPMASTTKIMTALVALDYFQLNSVLTVQTERVSGAGIGLKSGQKFYFKDLLYAMMLPSANDAAMAISQNYPGGSSAFIQKMNEKARAFHLSRTSYVDVVGLSPQNVTTASELAQLSSLALANTVIAQVVRTKQYVISPIGEDRVYNLSNLNKLLGEGGVRGVKTGFTQEAGEVLATAWDKDGKTLITVVMKSRDRFSDTAQLLLFVNTNIRYIQGNDLLN